MAAVDKTRTQMTSAQALKTAGKKGLARKALAKAVKAIQSFARILRSKKAKTVAQAERDALTAVAAAQRTALVALKQAP